METLSERPVDVNALLSMNARKDQEEEKVEFWGVTVVIE
jgi:hypothetical protein